MTIKHSDEQSVVASGASARGRVLPTLVRGALFAPIFVIGIFLTGCFLLFLLCFLVSVAVGGFGPPSNCPGWFKLGMFGVFGITVVVVGVGPLLCEKLQGDLPTQVSELFVSGAWDSPSISLFFLLAPGAIAVVLLIAKVIASQLGIEAMLYPWDFGIDSILMALPVALTLSIGVALIRSGHIFAVAPDHLYARSNYEWKNVAIRDVQQIDLVRNADTTESAYHEDDESQHHLAVRTADGSESSAKVLEIYFSKFDPPQRKHLLHWIEKNFDDNVFTSRARRVVLNAQPQVIGAPVPQLEQLEQFNFTTNWERDIQAHIGRTNYVPLEHGQVIGNGRYTINSYLNSGGFCTTYIAMGPGGARVVLKESALPENLPDVVRQQVSEMFAREARLLTRCSNDRIARIQDFFQEGNREYLVLDYIEGVPLSQLVRKGGAVPQTRVIEWAQSMAKFLIYLHELDPPIVHRDFTPENILLHRSGELYLIDFGAANEFIGQATGTLIGKQAYIAPEQLQGKAVPQSDIYAFGAVLYFLISGKEPLPLTELHPQRDGHNCDKQFDHLVAQCTKLDFHERPANGHEILRIVIGAQEGRGGLDTDQRN